MFTTLLRQRLRLARRARRHVRGAANDNIRCCFCLGWDVDVRPRAADLMGVTRESVTSHHRRLPKGERGGVGQGRVEPADSGAASQQG